jgi:hypothetical protein
VHPLLFPLMSCFYTPFFFGFNQAFLDRFLLTYMGVDY